MKDFPPCKENRFFVKGIHSITQNSPCIFKICEKTFFQRQCFRAFFFNERTLHLLTWKLAFVFLNLRYTCMGYFPSNPF